MPVRPLSPELAEKARVELGEDPKKLEDSIVHLRDWIAKQPHLRARTDDQWLALFIRGCKYSLERAKEKIDLYYSLRSIAPDLFSIKYSNPRFKAIDSKCFSVILKTATPTSPAVMLMRAGCYDPNEFHMLEVMSVSFIKQQIFQLELDELSISGARTILDLEGVTMGHFTQMTPTLMKKMVALGQDASPIRMKGAHYINTPPGFETLFNFIKGLLNEKNRKRLYVHNKNYEELYEYVPKEILPVEYGGSAGTLQEICEYWQKKQEEYKDWLEEDSKFGTDEFKRLGKPKSSEEMFGLDGSFRKLEFD